MDSIDKLQLEYCMSILSKDHYIRTRRMNELVAPVMVHKYTDRPLITDMLQTSIIFAPLLVGKIQFVQLNKRHLSFLKEEMNLRCIPYDTKKGVHALFKYIKDNEHQDWEAEMVKMNCEEKYELKFFQPRYLAAPDWDEDFPVVTSSYNTFEIWC